MCVTVESVEPGNDGKGAQLVSYIAMMCEFGEVRGSEHTHDDKEKD
jgi:hypothetical protein